MMPVTPERRRGGPIGPPGEKSGSKLSLPQKLPGGELAAYLGTTDIPVDVMATFGVHLRTVPRRVHTPHGAQKCAPW